MKVLEYKKANYTEIWNLQERLRYDCIDNGNEYLIFCEHQPVISYGRLANPENLKVSKEFLARNSIEFVQTNRGGDFTYHGPGMLVVYPIINIRKRGFDCITWIRHLEQWIIQALAEFKINSITVPKKTGTWVVFNGKISKIASIGIHVSKGVSIHGVCLNVSREPPFGLELINPCGLESHQYSFIRDFINVSFDEVQTVTKQIFLGQLLENAASQRLLVKSI